jgi:hypothetical protein
MTVGYLRLRISSIYLVSAMERVILSQRHSLCISMVNSLRTVHLLTEG